MHDKIVRKASTRITGVGVLALVVVVGAVAGIVAYQLRPNKASQESKGETKQEGPPATISWPIRDPMGKVSPIFGGVASPAPSGHHFSAASLAQALKMSSPSGSSKLKTATVAPQIESPVRHNSSQLSTPRGHAEDMLTPGGGFVPTPIRHANTPDFAKSLPVPRMWMGKV
jgi:hypothetical protein